MAYSAHDRLNPVRTRSSSETIFCVKKTQNLHYDTAFVVETQNFQYETRFPVRTTFPLRNEIICSKHRFLNCNLKCKLKWTVDGDLDALVGQWKFIEICCWTKPYDLGLLGVELETLRCTPVTDSWHTSSKLGSYFIDSAWFAAPNALQIISKQMMWNAVLLDNLCDIFRVGDKAVRTDPCGVPIRSWLTDDESLPVTTCCVRTAK